MSGIAGQGTHIPHRHCERSKAISQKSIIAFAMIQRAKRTQTRRTSESRYPVLIFRDFFLFSLIHNR